MKKLRQEIDFRTIKARRKLLSIEQEQELLASIRAGNFEAIEPLVDSYEYVILKILKELPSRHGNLDDTVNFIKEALRRLAITELHNKEPESFSHHSYWWIIGAANEFLNQDGR